MEIADYLSVVRRRWRWIAATLVVCVAAAAVLSLAQTKQYSSSARLFVSTSNLDDASALAQGGQFSQQRVQSYADLVTSRELAEQVISDLDLELSAIELARAVTASVTTNTVNLTITATEPDPHLAQSIAQAYAENVTDLVRELETPPGETVAPIKATIVDTASYSANPVAPKPARNVALGLIVGLLLGFGLALLRQTLDTRVNSTDDLREAVDCPVLGAINHDPDIASNPLISDLAPHAPRAEAFRVLRTNLQFVDIDNPQKVFVVTSAVPDEGKTSTATNLAISLAQAGTRTLLIEGDLRRPKAHQQLKLDGAVGLTSLLVGKVKLQDVLQCHQASGMDFIASGPVPPNPAELLQSKAMADLLRELRSGYDLVIIDAPPLLPVTDAALIAATADGALLVVRQGRSTRDQVRQAVDRLAHVDAALIGVVLNGVRSKAKGYGYGYGYAPELAAER